MKKLSRQVGSIALVIAILLSLCSSAFAVYTATRFADTEGHWAQDTIDELADRNVVAGFPDGSCRPDSLITRAQFSTLVARYFAYQPTGDISAFKDVKGHWAEDYISGLISAGIVTAVEYENTFKPDKPINRIEIVYMLIRALGLEEAALADIGNTVFTDDTEIEQIHKGYLNIAHTLGIVRGYGDGGAKPYLNATRAEAFVMFYRMMEANDILGKLNEVTPPLDTVEKIEKVGEEVKKAEEEKNNPAEEKPTVPKEPAPYYGGGGSSYVPAPTISFDFPETSYTGVPIVVTAQSTNAKSVVWTLTKDGEAVRLNAEDFNAEGGQIMFTEIGSYTLKAVAVNRRGKTTECEKTVTIYPVMALSFTLPANAHTDSSIPIELTKENVGSASITWHIERNNRKVTLSDVANGYLDSAGGLLQFKESGTYTVSASVTDELGRVTTCVQCVTVYPVVTLGIDLPATTHVDSSAALTVSGENQDGLAVEWSVTKDGESVTISDYITGELTDSGGNLCFTKAGTYTVTASMTDALGRAYAASDSITSYPVGTVGFFLPTVFHTDDTVKVEASITHLAGNALNWTLERNGRSVALTEYVRGTLNENGGEIGVNKSGEYTLTASFTDGGGRPYSYKQSFTVYPVPTVSIGLQRTAWTDSSLPVTVTAADIANVTIEWLVDNTYGYQDWNTFVDGRLTNSGGNIRFKRAGSYELVGRITDATGRVFLYEDQAFCEVQPVLDLSFTLPEVLPLSGTVDLRTMGNNNVLPVEWSLTKDGSPVSVSSCISGSLNNYGGKITFTDFGEFTLTASVKDALGRTFSHAENILVYPLVSYSVTLPDSASLGKSFVVKAAGVHLEGCTAEWSLMKDGRSVALRDYIADPLTINGGTASITVPGQYELACVVTDHYGNKTAASDTIAITNTAPNAPSVNAAVSYADIQSPFTESYKVKVSVTASAADPDGDTVNYEYAADSIKTGYYGKGNYTVKVRAKDQWGKYSGWTTKTISIKTTAPTVTLSSSTLGSNTITENGNVAFSASVASSTKYRISYLDYYTQSASTSLGEKAASVTAVPINGTYANGRHLLIVKVTDIYGNSAFASRFFAVGKSVGGDSAKITSLSTTIREEGIYDGATPLAYIDSFTFNIPAIGGHSTGCQDVVTITGVDASGAQHTLLSFNTNNGFTYVSSDGTYQYTQSSTPLSATWSGWKKNTYTKLIFHYRMTSGHEGCIQSATGGVQYTVNYSFIEGNNGNAESLFK